MNINKKISILLFAVSACFVSCEKYVDIKTQGNLVPDQVINYRYLLNNTSAFNVNPNLSDMASSDIEITDAAQMSDLQGQYYQYFAAAYNWQDVIYPKGTSYEEDRNWNAMYAIIMNANTVINEVPEAKGSETEKVGLKAEALVHRADAYLALLNTYAKPYNAATAGTDLGVPLLTTQTVSQSLSRASVQAVYDQIIKDLLEAVPGLPDTQAFTTLPSKASAYGELARCYQLMGDWANANKYADLALGVRNTLNDLGSYNGVYGTYPRNTLDPEILLLKQPLDGTRIYYPTVFKLSAEYRTLVGTTDLRYADFTVDASRITSTYTGRFYYKEGVTGYMRNEGPSVPEMMLIKAEYLARNADAAGAMEWVNKLRVKRFKPADFVARTATSADDALVKVINERRIEFFGTCLRWWDMRRLKDEPLFSKTYIRTFNGVTHTLAPNSNRYVFPIAEYLRGLNPELQQNP